ncbi:membrane protein insertion efficiency factor YidD [Methylovorus mays]|uniref:membrane protein insertion efficiency factor YidD n=1 Tax=Methylovorus mays TaxID=184077 RepID=UPI003898FEEA|nr:membrane protein insertion efficiency factor YidD [Methylovorus mays]
MKTLLVFLIRFYQRHLHKFHNRRCIYSPTCSNYGILAVRKYGAVKGAYYTYKRIKRCNGALYQGGEDYP